MFKKALLAALATASVLCLTVPASAETFTAANGVLSIDLPNENWKEMVDPSKWIALSDGGNLITIDHFSNGEKLPEITVADDHYVNVYQAVFSTQNEVFIITASIVDADKTAEVTQSIMSTKVLQYDTKLAVKKQETPTASEFSISPVSGTYYVTSNGLNVRQGCSTDSAIIGAYGYGEAVKVTGLVQRNGADYGWYQVSYENGTGYVSGSFLSTTQPAAKSDSSSSSGRSLTGNAKTVYKSDGTGFTIYEAKDGYWYDNSGYRFNKISDYTFISDAGNEYTTNKPVSNGPYAAGSAFTVFWLNGNATSLTPYSDGYYYTPDWVRYWGNGNGTYSGSDGTTLYVNAPDLGGNTSSTMVQCEYCGNWYEEGNIFRNHICPERDAANAAGGDYMVQCEYCGNWFTAGNEFRNHICPARDAAVNY